LNSLDLEFSKVTGHVPIEKWVEKIKLPSGPFTFVNHEYEKGILQERAPRQILKKGTQLGISETQILKTIYGLLYGVYPQGVLYLFPTQNDVYDFSRARFGPLLIENPEIGKEVRETESVSLKKIRKSMLYLRGARASSKIEGMKAMATQLLSIPVDRIVFDERDNMADNMIDLALERLGHSSIREEVYLGVPSIPDYGVDKLYNDSDGRVWEIQCSHCNKGTVLELEFPSCLIERQDGSVYRGCKYCGQEIYSKDGRWVAQYPERSKDMVGWWISRLNSPYADLKKILRTFQDPVGKNIQEFYNSTLAQAYISSENKLTPQDIYSNCNDQPMLTEHRGPACAGIDIGGLLHITIAVKPTEGQLQIVYVGRLSNFSDISDVCKRFNVRCCVVDSMPETRAVREWQASQSFPVFLCNYVGSVLSGPVWNERDQTLKTNRTEVLDWVHAILTSPGKIVLPQRCEEVEEFAKELTSMVRIVEEDEVGSRRFVWRKTAADHYFHSLAYCILASTRVGMIESREDYLRRKLYEDLGVPEQPAYRPFDYGLDSASRKDGYCPSTYGLDGNSYNPRD
jgi:hypothetical protein